MTENDIELSRPYAEKLRGTMEAALKGSGQEWRSVDIQVGFVTNIIAQAVSEARSQTYEECAKIAYLAALSHQDMADAENKEISDYDRQLHADIGEALDELGNMFHDAIRSKANQ